MLRGQLLTRIVMSSAITLSAFTASAQPAPPPARVETADVVRQLMAPEIQVPGTVISRNDARIAAEISGRVLWVAEVGDRIAEGGVIARVDDVFLRAQFQQAEAAVKRLEADLIFRNQEVTRAEELAKTDFSPVSRLEEAVANRTMIEQDLIQARAQFDLAGEALARTEIRSPFPGQVVERIVQIGEYLSPGAPVARVVDTEHLEVRAQAPIGLSNFIQEGMNVRISDDVTEVTNPIRATVAVGDEISRTMEVRISLAPDQWVIGTALKVDLPSSTPREVVAVPRDALILRATNVFVVKVGADNTASRIQVRTGAATGDLIEVIGDLGAGGQSCCSWW